LFGLPLVLLVVAIAAGLAAHAGKPIEVDLAEIEIPDDQLLDVAIQIFDPGLPEEDEDGLEKKGTFAEVRKSEARYIPFHLKSTLESTGHWGAVRVVPPGVESADVTIFGEILVSNGKTLALATKIIDSKGRLWREKKYKASVDRSVYYTEDQKIEAQDPYQDLYDRMANDLLRARSRLSVNELRELRDITWLRFAADLVPAAYGDYLEADRKGRLAIQRLPAADDPMMLRLRKVRERDYLFVDTLNEYYANFYARMDEPYGAWRKSSYDEQVMLQEIRREAMLKKILGGLLIFGGLAADPGSSVGRAAADVAVIGGVMVGKAGFDTGKEAKIHRDALRELAASFDAEMAPVLVEVEGQTLRIEGSAEGQFAEWRKMLAQIFVTETGLPVDPDTGDPAETENAEVH
jgi:hypothetical protein